MLGNASSLQWFNSTSFYYSEESEFFIVSQLHIFRFKKLYLIKQFVIIHLYDTTNYKYWIYPKATSILLHCTTIPIQYISLLNLKSLEPNPLCFKLIFLVSLVLNFNTVHLELLIISESTWFWWMKVLGFIIICICDFLSSSMISLAIVILYSGSHR
jgi:hypothetical protein